MSASVCLCFGLVAAFRLGSGSVREGGGVPSRARALALTALVTEKVFFLDLAIAGGLRIATSIASRIESEAAGGWYTFGHARD
jgi:hypothetical protein